MEWPLTALVVASSFERGRHTAVRACNSNTGNFLTPTSAARDLAARLHRKHEVTVCAQLNINVAYHLVLTHTVMSDCCLRCNLVKPFISCLVEGECIGALQKPTSGTHPSLYSMESAQTQTRESPRPWENPTFWRPCTSRRTLEIKQGLTV